MKTYHELFIALKNAATAPHNMVAVIATPIMRQREHDLPFDGTIPSCSQVLNIDHAVDGEVEDLDKITHKRMFIVEGV